MERYSCTLKTDLELQNLASTTQMLMYITYDEHTILLDNGVRFLVDRNQVNPTAYVVKQADTVSYSDAGEHGFISLTLYEDQFNPKVDNKELMIADYVSDPIGTGQELETKTDNRHLEFFIITFSFTTTILCRVQNTNRILNNLMC